MIIAVPFDNESIFAHFGHADAFKIYEIEKQKIVTVKILPAICEGHGALAGFLASLGVDTLICGGIGGGAKNALADVNITVYGGVSGNADIAVHSFLAGTLVYNPEAKCDHHGEHEHSCSSHSCKE